MFYHNFIVVCYGVLPLIGAAIAGLILVALGWLTCASGFESCWR